MPNERRGGKKYLEKQMKILKDRNYNYRTHHRKPQFEVPEDQMGVEEVALDSANEEPGTFECFMNRTKSIWREGGQDHVNPAALYFLEC